MPGELLAPELDLRRALSGLGAFNTTARSEISSTAFSPVNMQVPGAVPWSSGALRIDSFRLFKSFSIFSSAAPVGRDQDTRAQPLKSDGSSSSVAAPK